MKQPRRRHPNSKREVVKKRRAKDYGPYYNDGKEWTNVQMDLLCEGFLVHEWKHESVRESFHSEFGRSYHAIVTMFWKIIVKYVDSKSGRTSAAFFYHPDLAHRTKRTGLPFRERDRGVLEIWLRNRCEYGKADLVHIAGVLGRESQEVQEFLETYAKEKLPQRRRLDAPRQALDAVAAFEELLNTMKDAFNGYFNKYIKNS